MPINYLREIAEADKPWSTLDWFANRNYPLTQQLLNLGYLDHFGDWSQPHTLITPEGREQLEKPGIDRTFIPRRGLPDLSEPVQAPPEPAPEPTVIVKAAVSVGSSAPRKLVTIISTGPEELRCPYCFGEDMTIETIKCGFCNASQHKVCYDEHGKCVTCGRLVGGKEAEIKVSRAERPGIRLEPRRSTEGWSDKGIILLLFIVTLFIFLLTSGVVIIY
jgi:hypothetical protein